MFTDRLRSLARSSVGRVIDSTFRLRSVARSRGILFLLCAFLPACAGSASLHLTPLNYQSIDPPSPAMIDLNMDHCCWFTDDAGQVCIAMNRTIPSILGEKFRFDFLLSLVLEKLPAGKARNYNIRSRELRALARGGPAESRFTSHIGILALYREAGDRLRGNLRLEVGRQESSFLGVWTRPARYLLLGSFEAVHDERRARPILEESESSGFTRPPPPATQPASSAPAASQAAAPITTNSSTKTHH